MTDPDVPGPSDPYLREHLHWYALNSIFFKKKKIENEKKYVKIYKYEKIMINWNYFY